ncbi:hypothetical protein [Sodalis sp.]|uniref:hypothetical protein n=1 Tax=Sodalis sp. (in: enterobacteria) TaxID=1898979 RepID=UPI0038738BC5
MKLCSCVILTAFYRMAAERPAGWRCSYDVESPANVVLMTGVGMSCWMASSTIQQLMPKSAA